MRRIALVLSVLAALTSLTACAGGDDLTGLKLRPSLLDTGTDPSSGN